MATTAPHTAPTEPDKRGFTEIQAAHYIGMSASYLRISRMDGDRANRTPAPPYAKVGKRVIYLREDLDAWLEAHRVNKGRQAA